MTTRLDQVAWHADERRLYIRRIRELLKGETVHFPNGLMVYRGAWSYLIFEGGKQLKLTEAIGREQNAQKRIEKIVEWILERTKHMDTIELSSQQLVILDDLFQHGPRMRGEFKGRDLEALYQHRFIHDLHPGKIEITSAGQDYLMPPTKGEGAPPNEQQPVSNPSPVAEPEPAALTGSASATKRKPVPAANGVLNPKTLRSLITIARAGGEIKRSDIHHFTVDKLLLEGLIEESGADRIAVTPLGLARLEQDDALRAAVSQPATAGTTPPSKKPKTPAPTAIMPVAQAEPEARPDCADCAHKRILEALMAESPLVRRTVERMVALDGDLQRLRSLE